MQRQPFLWQVTGPHGSIVLYATFQAAAGYHAAPPALDELDRASVFVTEVDEMPSASELDGEHARMFYLPEGTTLKKLLSDADYRQLKRRVDRPVLHLRPWVAMMLLAREAYEFPTPSLSTALVRRARERRIPIEFLESWDDQLKFFDEAVTATKLAVMIRDYPKLACVMQGRLDAFRAGDDAVFVKEAAAEAEPTVRRNARWATQLETYLTSGQHAFVALGIGQVVGPHGVLAQLAARGYTVQRMR